MYKKFVKRIFDLICAFAAVTVFFWIYLIVAILVRIKLGSPILFKQKRPGKDGKIFTLYKFRTMNDAKDKDGNLLPDNIRLTSFGKALRATSLDELPEVINIIKGDMSIIGPRPQLVRDMVFFTKQQMKRQSVRPGLSGLAQISGRNGISWEEKLNYDLQYIENITFLGDCKIIALTFWQAFVKRDGIAQEGMDTAEDLGDYLLERGDVTKEEYSTKQSLAMVMLENN
ncbi:MAG: sugar transferase [Eubacteriales bacterium]|nr:sugar transferase [Eubacteriales bacterium]